LLVAIAGEVGVDSDETRCPADPGGKRDCGNPDDDREKNKPEQQAIFLILHSNLEPRTSNFELLMNLKVPISTEYDHLPFVPEQFGGTGGDEPPERKLVTRKGERPYAELRAASAFSFLDGASLPEDLIYT